MNEKLPHYTRVAPLVALLFLGIWGFVSVVFPVNPFLDDELRIVYNLKMKSAGELWGALEFMQEFPRVYLQVIKLFCSVFDYSYFSLRFSSFFMGIAVMSLGWSLANRLYKRSDANRFLFVLVIVSSYTFTQYFTQVKQYTMEIFLSLVAVWQLLILNRLFVDKAVRSSYYILLCISFFAAPFFSYTYPIAVAPAMAIGFLFALSVRRQHSLCVRILLPLLLASVGILIFYLVDVAHLMKDNNMRRFWGHLMYVDGFELTIFIRNISRLFSQVGSGDLFAALFLVFGFLGFVAGVRNLFSIRTRSFTDEALMVSYATLLLSAVIILNLFRKLPVGEPRLNAFTVPAIIILILNFFSQWRASDRWVKLAVILPILLYAGVIGNLFTSCVALYTHPMYTKRMEIYRNTEVAVAQAMRSNTPILITPGVAYPFDTCWNMPYNATVPGDWVLKTFPAYLVEKKVPVYAIPSIDQVDSALLDLPMGTTEIMVGDGVMYKTLPIDSQY